MKPYEIPQEVGKQLSRLRQSRVKSGRRLLWAALTYLVLLVTVVGSVIPQQVQLKQGDVATRDIEAPMTIVNRLATEAEKKARVAAVEEVWSLDLTVADTVAGQINGAFDRIRAANADSGVSESQRAAQVSELLDFNVANSAVLGVLRLNAALLGQLEENTVQIVRNLLQGGVKAERLSEIKTQAAAQIDALNFDKAPKTFAAALAGSVLRPNFVFDEAETNRRRELARVEVERNPVKILRGQSVIRKGDAVTEEQIAILEDLGLLRQQADYGRILGLGLFVLLLVVLVGMYLAKFNPAVYHNESYLVLLGLVVSLTLMISKILGGVSPLLVPVAAGAMLVAVLLDIKLANMINVVLSLLAGVVLGNELRLMVVAMVSGFAAVFSLSRVNQRSDLTRSGLYIGVANILATLGMGAVAGASLLEVLRESFLGTLGLANGLIVVVLVNGFLPYLENNFGITTAVKLSELSNPSHPLLRRLLIETPGTYHHSIIVGNLAEAAAEAVDGEPLLARAGAYYHDVGKIKRPYFFVENQLSGGNPHDRVSPNLSTLMITSHIKDGVELAREYKLPAVIADIIRQHHGTSLVKYFYQLAAGKDSSEPVAEEDFRYEGPKPQTKEAAIVMLADSVEAAVRSLAKPTKERIEAMVRSILQDRLQDGQLDESALTFKDVDRIAATFVRILQGIFHARIEYPETNEPADRGGSNGNPDHESVRDGGVGAGPGKTDGGAATGRA